MPTENDKEPKKGSLTARFAAGWAFSAIGAKLGFLAAPFDFIALSDKDASLGDKVRGVFDGTLKQRFDEKKAFLINLEGKNGIERFAENSMAVMKIAKWTMIVGTITSIAAFIVGWIRGGLIEKTSDIYHHPVRSTKIILGLEKPPTPEQPQPTPEEQTEAPAKRWSDGKSKPSSRQEALVQEKPAEAGVSI